MLTAVCMATKWPEAIPLKNVMAKTVAEGMVDIFSRTAIPLQILSDQGTQFLSALVEELCSLLGIQQLKTTAYHPQTNGTVERMHATLEGMLTKAQARLGASDPLCPVRFTADASQGHPIITL